MNQNDTRSNELAQSEKGRFETNTTANNGTSRRKFLGQVGAALAGGAVLGKAAIASGQDYNPAIRESTLSPTRPPPRDPRVKQSLAIRNTAATLESQIPVPPHTTNGDEQLYPDKSGTYSKGILQDGIGLVNLAAFQTLRDAINSGKFEDFENVITGGPRTQIGPLGGRAFALEGSDPVQFGNATSPANQINQVVVPPAPALASEAYGTELVEMYWASLLREVAFTDYVSNATAAQVAAELSSMPSYAGPRDGSGNVTPDLLFRGTYPGDTLGPYLSQFHLQPTYLGTQPLDQQMVTFLPDIVYMTAATTYQQVQNDINTEASLQLDLPLRYPQHARRLCSFNHVH